MMITGDTKTIRGLKNILLIYYTEANNHRAPDFHGTAAVRVKAVAVRAPNCGGAEQVNWNTLINAGIFSLR